VQKGPPLPGATSHVARRTLEFKNTKRTSFLEITKTVYSKHWLLVSPFVYLILVQLEEEPLSMDTVLAGEKNHVFVGELWYEGHCWFKMLKLMLNLTIPAIHPQPAPRLVACMT
jgi:hypothetical protein